MTRSKNKGASPHPIYWVGGSKGGVGKSTLAMVVVDFLTSRGDEVQLVDCDESCAQVAEKYGAELWWESIDLDHAEGWIRLVDLCASHPERPVIVDSASRSRDGFVRHGAILETALVELRRKLVGLWVIDRQLVVLEALRDFMLTLPSAVMHVVCNAHFGRREQFELYDRSKVRDAVERRGGRTVGFPSSPAPYGATWTTLGCCWRRHQVSSVSAAAPRSHGGEPRHKRH